MCFGRRSRKVVPVAFSSFLDIDSARQLLEAGRRVSTGGGRPPMFSELTRSALSATDACVVEDDGSQVFTAPVLVPRKTSESRRRVSLPQSVIR